MSPASVPPLAGGGKNVTARMPDCQRNGADANVAEPRVVLLVTGGPDRFPTIRDQCQIDVGDIFPKRRGLFDLLFPGRRRIVRVQGLVQRTRSPPTLVPSGMKLYVIRLAYVH